MEMPSAMAERSRRPRADPLPSLRILFAAPRPVPTPSEHPLSPRGPSLKTRTTLAWDWTFVSLLNQPPSLSQPSPELTLHPSHFFAPFLFTLPFLLGPYRAPCL